MAECRKCKRSIGGFLGAAKAMAMTIEQAEKRGIDHAGLCDDCLQAEVDNGPSMDSILATREEAERQRIQNVKDGERASMKKAQDLISEKKRQLDAIVVSTAPHPAEWTHEIVGVVNGFSVIGTGILTEFFSSFTDAFGSESKAYHDKLATAKNNAMLRAKEDALRIGANMVFGLQVNITEMSAGNGMLMFAVTGTALKHKDD